MKIFIILSTLLISFGAYPMECNQNIDNIKKVIDAQKNITSTVDGKYKDQPLSDLIDRYRLLAKEFEVYNTIDKLKKDYFSKLYCKNLDDKTCKLSKKDQENIFLPLNNLDKLYDYFKDEKNVQNYENSYVEAINSLIKQLPNGTIKKSEMLDFIQQDVPKHYYNFDNKFIRSTKDIDKNELLDFSKFKSEKIEDIKKQGIGAAFGRLDLIEKHTKRKDDPSVSSEDLKKLEDTIIEHFDRSRKMNPYNNKITGNKKLQPLGLPKTKIEDIEKLKPQIKYKNFTTNKMTKELDDLSSEIDLIEKSMLSIVSQDRFKKLNTLKNGYLKETKRSCKNQKSSINYAAKCLNTEILPTESDKSNNFLGLTKFMTKFKEFFTKTIESVTGYKKVCAESDLKEFSDDLCKTIKERKKQRAEANYKDNNEYDDERSSVIRKPEKPSRIAKKKWVEPTSDEYIKAKWRYENMNYYYNEDGIIEGTGNRNKSIFSQVAPSIQSNLYSLFGTYSSYKSHEATLPMTEFQYKYQIQREANIISYQDAMAGAYSSYFPFAGSLYYPTSTFDTINTNYYNFQ